jgi:metal-sulfur cluster biosynthetic enzyme
MISESDVYDALRDVIDPDIGINIVDLGLVESVVVAESGVSVGLIMTTPACPQSAYIQDEATRLIATMAPAGTPVAVEVLDSPFWQPDRMSESAKTVLGWPG